MSWPFQKKTEEPTVPTDPEKKPEPPKTSSEKSVAEIISESLAPFSQRFDKLQQDIDALRTPPPPARREPTEIPSVLDDENAAFAVRMTPILQTTLEIEAREIMRDVKQEYVDAGFGAIWQQNETEIKGVLNGTALVQPDGQGGTKKLRGDAQYVRNVADMIIGRAARAGGVRFDGAKKTFFLEGANSNESVGGAKSAEVEGLTQKQVKLAQRLGIPLDKFKQTVSKLEFTN